MLDLFWSCGVGFFGALALSGVLTKLVIVAATRYSFVDAPDGVLKKHAKSVPYGGGVSVFAAWFLMIMAMCGFTWIFSSDYTYFIAGASVLFTLGFCDDMYAYRAHTKFLIQIIAALLFLMGGFYLKEDFLLGNMWCIPGSFFWILTITNAFNLIDIMDGLAGTTAAGIVVSFMVVSCCLGQLGPLLFLSIFLGALCGFLCHNLPNATIYLGDAGSLFIGGTVAVLPFCFTWGVHQPWLGYSAPAIIILIPIAEVCALIYIRSGKGISPFTGSPDHFAHYLLRSNYTKYHVLWFVMVNQLFLSSIAIMFSMAHISFFALMLLVGVWLHLWVTMVYAREGHMYLLQKYLVRMKQKKPSI